MPEAASGTSRNRSVNRRPEEEAIERRGPGRSAAADLLAHFRKPPTGPAAGQGPADARPASPAEPAQTAPTAPAPEPAAGHPARTVAEVAADIAARAARFLPGGAPDSETDLFDAGLSSVDAVELVALMARELDVQLTLDDVFADARPRRLAQRWAKSLGLPTTTSPAPGTPTPGTPAPEFPTTGLPAPAASAPGTPTPGTPAPEFSTAGLPAPAAPTPGTPVAGTPAPAASAPVMPAPEFPTAGLPASAAAAPGTPAPGTPAPAAPTPPRATVPTPTPPRATVPTPTPHTPTATIPTATPTPTPSITPVIIRTPTHPTHPDAHEDLEVILEDLALADRLPFSRQAEAVAPRRILLTGATGYLGSHLLLDLLRQGDAHVVCLVRATDDAAAERRLADALAGFDQPWTAEVRRRVTVLAADLRQPLLGLARDVWEGLAQDLDSIVNVAAAVDFLRGYPSLRQTNVLGPLALAELAMTGRAKPLHHISSVAVFNEVGIEKMGEDDPVAHIDRLFAGYDKSKWAAEAVLRRAREHGLTVTFLRPGAIGGHTRTGVYNPHDLSTGLIGAFSRYRTVPAFKFMNLAPVDWISRVTAAVVFDPAAWGQNYNVTGRAETLPQLVKDMKLAGMNVRVANWREWRDDLIERHAADPVPELDFLIRILRSPTAMKLFEALMFGPEAGSERTDRFVARHKLPEAERYGSQAQLKAFERMAKDGVARLPSREDPPYLQFRERTKGRIGPVGGERDSRCRMALTLSIASMYQVVRHRKIDVRGEVFCERLHAEPLTVEAGEIWVRPDEGVPLQHGSDHPLLRYRLVLVDRDGGRWWLEGWKTARASRDFWKQTRTIDVTIGRENEPASLAGVVKVPAKSYVPDQIDGIEVDPRLTSQERRLAKLAWLSWFFVQVGMGLAEPSLRAVAELLDLRKDAIDRDQDKLQRKIRKLMIKREQTR
ncbi:thioester reductase domain-containing protein [Streptomyces sp. Je 1-369]|uniref:thioester reductase domain-containing protein n=1 Tax=Streptomyces sp. Je 1-369 TaxID=2966192 RepID=UPI002285E87B|nr:thioester reductase domain-containing protein [Streptomyces sp. Je 1-369]